MKPAFQSFDENMRFSSAYRRASNSPRWEVVKNLYNSFTSRPPDGERIPRILHQIWLGGEIPGHYRPMSRAIRDMHPNWEYRLWTDKNSDFDFSNREVFDKCTNMGQKSDILRYELLRRFGGVYLDMDFIAVRPLDPLLGLDFFAGVGYDEEPQLANGLMGSTPGNLIANRLCLQNELVPSDGAMDIMRATGPDFLTRVFFESCEGHGLGVALPNAFFMPYPNFPHDRILGEEPSKYYQNDTLCCHLWHCSWLKKPKAGLRQRLRRLLPW